MQMIVTEGTTLVYADKEYTGGDKVDINEDHLEALLDAGHIISKEDLKRRKAADVKADEERKAAEKEAENETAK